MDPRPTPDDDPAAIRRARPPEQVAAKPLDDPETVAWISRIQQGSMNDGGSHAGSQPKREDPTVLDDPYRIRRPFVRSDP